MKLTITGKGGEMENMLSVLARAMLAYVVFVFLLGLASWRRSSP